MSRLQRMCCCRAGGGLVHTAHCRHSSLCTGSSRLATNQLVKAAKLCPGQLATATPLHSGKIRHLTWTFPKRYLRCPSTAQYSPVQPSTAQYFLVNVQVKWLILPLCTVPIVRCLLSQACLAPSSKLKNHGNFFI